MRRFVSLLAMLLVTVACGDGESDPAATDAEPTNAAATQPSTAETEASVGATTSSDADSCGLLTLDDVTSRGIDVATGPNPNEYAPNDECTFTPEEIGVGVFVILYSPDEAAALGPDLYPNTDILTGIGEEACYVEDLMLVQVRLADGRVISIQDLTESGNLRQNLIELAEIATSRA